MTESTYSFPVDMESQGKNSNDNRLLLLRFLPGLWRKRICALRQSQSPQAKTLKSGSYVESPFFPPYLRFFQNYT